LRIEDEFTDMFMTSAPSRLPAISKEDWVRVEASKNRLTWVRPRREVRFLSTWRLSSTYSSERSSRMADGARAKRGCLSYPPVCPLVVMPGFMSGIHVFNKFAAKQDVDGRNKSGHDGV
jgi:hypothetical protein